MLFLDSEALLLFYNIIFNLVCKKIINNRKKITKAPIHTHTQIHTHSLSQGKQKIKGNFPLLQGSSFYVFAKTLVVSTHIIMQA